MKKILLSPLLLLFFLLSTLQTQAQGKTDNFTEAENEVVTVIKQMFDGMRKGDSTMLRAVFHPSVRFQSIAIHGQTGKPVIQTENSADSFVKAIGTPHTDVYDERIESYEVRIDGLMATVWTPYEFYLGTKFSHCGVNAFLLFKGEQGWKIINITDTRRRKDCKGK
jgi:Putative lumazine-binding